MISAFLSTSAEPEIFDEIPDEQELFFSSSPAVFSLLKYAVCEA